MSASLRTPANAIFNWGRREEDKSSLHQFSCSKSHTLHLTLPGFLTALRKLQLFSNYKATWNLHYALQCISRFLSLSIPRHKWSGKVVQFFFSSPKSNPPRQKILCSCGWMADWFFPPIPFLSLSKAQLLASDAQNLALCSPLLHLYPGAWSRSPETHSASQAVVSAKGLQLFSETHLWVTSKARVDSLWWIWWICSLQWSPQRLSQAYIPSLTRNMMHRLCNRHCVQSSQSSWSKNVSSRQSWSIYIYINEDA